MATYIAFLRGVNVGGHNKIAMSDLKKMLTGLGFQDILTYIQSGNIVFTSRAIDPSAIGKTVKQGLKDRFSIDAEVLVVSLEGLLNIIEANPFGEAGLGEGEKIYVTFLSKDPEGRLVEKLAKVDGRGDKLGVVGRTAYLLCLKGYSETAYSNNMIEKALGVVATTRNLDTVKKLAEMAGGVGA